MMVIKFNDIRTHIYIYKYRRIYKTGHTHHRLYEDNFTYDGLDTNGKYFSVTNQLS